MTSGVTPHSAISALIASEIPVLTSSLVGRLTAPSTSLPDRRTESVFVPPTSTPMRIGSLHNVWINIANLAVIRSDHDLKSPVGDALLEFVLQFRAELAWPADP